MYIILFILILNQRYCSLCDYLILIGEPEPIDSTKSFIVHLASQQCTVCCFMAEFTYLKVYIFVMICFGDR